ncbi:MAG: STAS domain-containing protein [Clostridia bacterium]|nr:STAS domain-containing protein [Clostridia bacterium]
MKTEYENKKSGLHIYLKGELDHHSAKTLCEQIDTKLAIFKPHTVFLDFGQVTFMDSSGLAVVAGRKRMCDLLKSKIYITNVSGYPEKILRLSGADKIVEFLEEKDEN